MCPKRNIASSAAWEASRGRMKTLGTDSMAAMERISLEHLHAMLASALTVTPVLPRGSAQAFWHALPDCTIAAEWASGRTTTVASLCC